jgi:hypothetical protein
MHGRNKPITLGQVGIRCMHCKFDNPAERGQQSTSFPSLISGIYNSVQQMLRLHLECCLSMPHQVRARIEELKVSCSSRGGRKQYWIDSAKRLGLIDTPHGIYFGRDPKGTLPPLSGPSVNSKNRRSPKSGLPKKSSKFLDLSGLNAMGRESPSLDDDEGGDDDGTDADDDQDLDDIVQPSGVISPERINIAAIVGKEKEKKSKVKEKKAKDKKSLLPPPPPPPVDSRPLVFPEDKALISDYLYLTLEQMAPCSLSDSDRVGCYKTRKTGFPGLACKHCVGQAGCGRYFPASEASLSQTTTSQTVMNHVRNCRRVPADIRENLELMKRNRMGPDGKRSDKPKHGGRKVFFHRLWCRIQNIPFEDGKGETKESKRSRRKAEKKLAVANGSDVETSDDDDVDIDEDLIDDLDDNRPPYMIASENDTDTDDEGRGRPSKADKFSNTTSKVSRVKKSSVNKVDRKKTKATTAWWPGCVNFTKPDDSDWLSEMECFVRSEIIEAFSLESMDDIKISYQGRKIPSVGQVGIQCHFCKELDLSERSPGSMMFPESLDQIHVKVESMVKQHLSSCHRMPDDIRDTFKSFRGFDAKLTTDDSEQYWIYAARDAGLANIPPVARDEGGWGMTFRRDPLEPSPADELDFELDGIPLSLRNDGTLIKDTDRGLCPDQLFLMMLQVRACRFQISDRRLGPNSRGRDRALGFPGLCCVHCTNKNTLGRYFPVSAKNLTDSTANSLQAHVASCARCPEPIRASLSYLSHRAAKQKTELSGIWKKKFFKTIWERIHVQRNWKSIDGEVQETEDRSLEDEPSQSTNRVGILANVASSMRSKIKLGKKSSLANESEKGKDSQTHLDADSPSLDDGGTGESDQEELGEAMNALIKAAAIWLTEQDAIGEKPRAPSAPRVSRGRTLPGKRKFSDTSSPEVPIEDVSSERLTKATISRTRNGGTNSAVTNGGSKRRRAML